VINEDRVQPGQGFGIHPQRREVRRAVARSDFGAPTIMLVILVC
jgi:hypothetical protein